MLLKIKLLWKRKVKFRRGLGYFQNVQNHINIQPVLLWTDVKDLKIQILCLRYLVLPRIKIKVE